MDYEKYFQACMEQEDAIRTESELPKFNKERVTVSIGGYRGGDGYAVSRASRAGG